MRNLLNKTVGGWIRERASELEDGGGPFCCQCWNAVCDVLDPKCSEHEEPPVGMRWCHAYKKLVFDLDLVGNCPKQNID